MKLCVYGSLSAPKQVSWITQAARLGRELAQRGHTLVFGGGTGLLGAAAQAALGSRRPAAGRHPNRFHFGRHPCPALTPKVPAAYYRQRKQQMEELADGVLILPGGIGTWMSAWKR